MPALPRLNQLCTIFPVARTGDRGRLAKQGAGTTISCRYAIGTKVFRDSRGQDVEYHAGIHLDYFEGLKKGMAIVLDNGNSYEIIECVATPDLDGNYFKHYCRLKEYDYA